MYRVGTKGLRKQCTVTCYPVVWQGGDNAKVKWVSIFVVVGVLIGLAQFALLGLILWEHKVTQADEARPKGKISHRHAALVGFVFSFLCLLAFAAFLGVSKEPGYGLGDSFNLVVFAWLASFAIWVAEIFMHYKEDLPKPVTATSVTGRVKGLFGVV